MVDSFTKEARRAIEELYADIASVIGFTSAKDPVTKETMKRECILVEDMPCRVSFGKSQPSSLGEPAQMSEQSITLFCPPDREIPPGSHIEVIRCGKTLQFESSGVPALYGSHQEVALKYKDFS